MAKKKKAKGKKGKSASKSMGKVATMGPAEHTAKYNCKAFSKSTGDAGSD